MIVSLYLTLSSNIYASVCSIFLDTSSSFIFLHICIFVCLWTNPVMFVLTHKHAGLSCNVNILIFLSPPNISILLYLSIYQCLFLSLCLIFPVSGVQTLPPPSPLSSQSPPTPEPNRRQAVTVPEATASLHVSDTTPSGPEAPDHRDHPRMRSADSRYQQRLRTDQIHWTQRDRLVRLELVMLFLETKLQLYNSKDKVTPYRPWNMMSEGTIRTGHL